MRIILIALTISLSMSVHATTLRNVTLDELVEKADEVALLRIVEAKVLDIEQVQVVSQPPSKFKSEPYEEEEEAFSGIYSDKCGINVKAQIVHNYKSSKKQYLEFTTMEHIEIGSSYLAFLNKIESKTWYSSIFSSFRISGKVAGEHPNEIKCLENTLNLKATAFPQRLMKYDEERWLDASLNNILFPNNVIFEAERKQSVIQQYNEKRIDFRTVHEYLLDLKNKKSSNKKLVSDAKNAQNN